MNFLSKFFSFFIIIFSNFYTQAEDMMISNSNAYEGIEYKVTKDGTHVIHILEIDPKLYRFELVKAHDSVFGRETVPEIATRKGAIAAINAGFFEIGGSEDGRPSGNLVINGKILALAQKYQSSLILDEDKFDIANIRGYAKIKYRSKEIKIDKVNQFAKKDEVVLYNSLWGPATLTSKEGRREFVIDENSIITQSYGYGDNQIPASGWMLSLPSSHELATTKIGDKLVLDISFKEEASNLERPVQSSIMGVPILVDNGQINSDSFNDGSFFTQPHARTAIGFKADGTIIMLVAERVYNKPIEEVNLGEVRDVLKNHGYSGDKLNEISIAKALVLVGQGIRPEGAATGLTIPELAQIMLDLGCVKALNLDGGGSSTMFLDGEVVNSTVGDSDEGMGQKVVRPVSDAIVVMKK
jgi:exopolysaccharide biosynthesis protein